MPVPRRGKPLLRSQKSAPECVPAARGGLRKSVALHMPGAPLRTQARFPGRMAVKRKRGHAHRSAGGAVSRQRVARRPYSEQADRQKRQRQTRATRRRRRAARVLPRAAFQALRHAGGLRVAAAPLAVADLAQAVRLGDGAVRALRRAMKLISLSLTPTLWCSQLRDARRVRVCHSAPARGRGPPFLPRVRPLPPWPRGTRTSHPRGADSRRLLRSMTQTTHTTGVWRTRSCCRKPCKRLELTVTRPVFIRKPQRVLVVVPQQVLIVDGPPLRAAARRQLPLAARRAALLTPPVRNGSLLPSQRSPRRRSGPPPRHSRRSSSSERPSATLFATA